MNDKTVIITGANSGIGRAAAIRFAGENYRVIMACRNLDKGMREQQEIIHLTKNSNIDMLKLDISSFGSTRDFCSEFKKKYRRLDILINNAGYFKHGEKEYQLSPDNIELSFATNAFGPFLMTSLLADMLKKSDDPRVLNACSTNVRHFFEKKREIDFDNLRGEFRESRPYNSYKMYGDSKMALLMLTFKMADEFREDGIKINAIQIPAIKLSKDSIRKFKAGWKIAAHVQNLFSASPDSMADTYFHICTSEKFKEVTGRFINDRRELMQSSFYKGGFIEDVKQLLDHGVFPEYAGNSANIEKVWNMAVRLTQFPDIKKPGHI